MRSDSFLQMYTMCMHVYEVGYECYECGASPTFLHNQRHHPRDAYMLEAELKPVSMMGLWLLRTA